uniref:Uncharacterized protein n=1 Tax=Micrurus corallinus TaxID=54390 RepID=A0A2D4GPA5_MICCO
MKFEKVDGSLTQGLPSTCLTEPVTLRPGSHEETAVHSGPENVRLTMLGLAWLKKWNPAVDWKDSNWRWRSRAGGPQRIRMKCRGSKTPPVGRGKIEPIS